MSQTRRENIISGAKLQAFEESEELIKGIGAGERTQVYENIRGRRLDHIHNREEGEVHDVAATSVKS